MKRESQQIEKINAAAGGEWEFECDYAEIYKVYTSKEKDGSYVDRLGEAIFWYVQPLADSIESFCKDPLQKEALVEGATNRKIMFKLLPAAFKEVRGQSHYWGGYCRTVLTNGSLEVQVPLPNFCCNVSDVGRSLNVCFDDPKSLMTLMARKDIAKYTEEKLKDYLEVINTATGVEFEVEVDFGVILENWKKAVKDQWDNEQGSRVGEWIYDAYLGALAENIKRLCSDDLSKEAFVDAVSKKIINIVVIPELKKGENSFYCRCKIVDGKLVLEILGTSFPCNVSEAGSDIEKLL